MIELSAFRISWLEFKDVGRNGSQVAHRLHSEMGRTCDTK